MIGIVIVTGFLGSGKTTLLNRVLQSPDFARSAVIVNEFGAIGLDHSLMASGDDRVLTLANGCLCCAAQSDLAATLHDLARRFAGRYDRVLIETSGLADPAPVMQALLADARLGATHRLETVLTVIDAEAGMESLSRHPEARRQMAMADRIALSKTDRVPADPALLKRIAALAPGIDVAHVADPAATLFAPADAAARAARLSLTPARPRLIAEHGRGHVSVALRRTTPIPGAALSLWLDALAAQCGPKLLRLKGIAEIAELPGRPAVVHAVGHRLAPPIWLEAWPDEDHGTRIVVIAEDMPEGFPARLLGVIEAEVMEAEQVPAIGP
ncbi:MAG: GTP-binding protein [Rhodospirillales bacterium]|nr:GTP-binding protein [Rhodospirillales bacterium]